MNNTIHKIKKDYLEYLSDEDKSILYNNPLESDVRKIVNNIWRQYLTPIDIKKGEDFRFLVIKGGFFADPDAEIQELPAFNNPTNEIKLLNKETFENDLDRASGFIVDINWMKATPVLLPNDFLIKRYFVKTRLKPLALFNVNMGEESINSMYEYTKIFAEDNGLPFVSLNKRLYNPSFQMTKNDKSGFLNDIMTYFMMRHEINTPTDPRPDLIKKYGKYILGRYMKLLEEDNFNSSTFISEINKHIENSEGYPTLSINKLS